MELFEPQNFFQMADLLAGILTGAIAIAGLLIALLTYKVAAKALLEWKSQKNLEFVERFLKVFYKSKNYIYYLRNPLAVDSEIQEKYKKAFYKNEVLNAELFTNHYTELIILSRRENSIPMLEELLELKSLSKIYVKENSLITQYIDVVINLDKKILKASKSISVWTKYLKDPSIDVDSDNYKKKFNLISDNRNIVYGSQNDDIYKELETSFTKCDTYLAKLLNNYKKL